MQKSKIIAIIICLIMSASVYAEPENILPQAEREVLETIYPETPNTEQPDITQTSEQQETVAEEKLPAESLYKQPVSKRKILKKFLLAMIGVVGSALVLFAILSLYKFITRGGQNSNMNTDIPMIDDASELETPDNLTDAVKSFIEKTNWD